jgi:MFS family permease
MKKIIRNYSIFMLFQGLAISFFFATYQLFLLEKGLSLLEINILNGSFMLANFLFEIPTGVIADYFGRKRSVIIGLWVFAFSFLIYFLSDHFWQFLVAEIIGAIAATCISGALESLVVEAINEEEEQNNYEPLFRKGEIKNIGILIGVVIGSYVGQFNLAWPWMLSVISFSLLALLSNFLFKKDESPVREAGVRNFVAIKKIAQDSISYGFKNKRLMLIVSFSAILSFAIQPINMYWPILFKENFNVEVKFIGLIFAAIILSIYGASQLSKLWQKRIKCEKNAIFFSQIFTILGIFGCYFFLDLSLFIISLLIHEGGRGLFTPLYRAYINKSINNKNRATVLSFESMLIKAGAGLGLVFSGLIADHWGILNSWLISAVILIIGTSWFLFKNKKN